VGLVDVTVDGGVFTNAEYQAATSLLAFSDLENGVALRSSTCSTHQSFPCISSLNSVLDARTICFPHSQLSFSSNNSSFRWFAFPSSFPKLSFSPLSFVYFYFKVSSLSTIIFPFRCSHQTPESLSSSFEILDDICRLSEHTSGQCATWDTSGILYNLKLPDTSFELVHCHIGTVLDADWSTRHNESFVVSGGEEEMALIWKVGGSVFEFEVWLDGWVHEDFSSVLRIDMTASPRDIGQVFKLFHPTVTTSDRKFLHLFNPRTCGGVPVQTTALAVGSRSAFVRATVNFNDDHSVRSFPSPTMHGGRQPVPTSSALPSSASTVSQRSLRR